MGVPLAESRSARNQIRVTLARKKTASERVQCELVH